MQIRMRDIPQEGLRVEGEITPKEMDVHEISYEINASFGFSLFLEVVDGVFIAKGSYSGLIDFICDRCLKEFTRNPSNDNYVYATEISAIKDETIDLTDGLREDILLSLPIKVLCCEDCKGICPNCGADLNIEKCECKHLRDTTPFSELDKLI